MTAAPDNNLNRRFILLIMAVLVTTSSIVLEIDIRD